MNAGGSLPVAMQVRTMQIIWFALLAGVITFAGVAFLSHSAPQQEPFISYVALATAGAAAVMSLVVPLVIGRSLVANVTSTFTRETSLEDASSLLAIAYQTRLIISLAILEGAAFFCLMALQLEGFTWILAVVGGLCFLMLVRFPTVGHVQDWCRTEYESAMLNQPR